MKCKIKGIDHSIRLFLEVMIAGLVWMALTWGKHPIAALFQYACFMAAVYLIVENNKNAKSSPVA